MDCATAARETSSMPIVHPARTLLLLGIPLLLLPLTVAAADQVPTTAEEKTAVSAERTHGLIFLAGGQFGFREYKSFLKLGAGYNLHLKEKLWLDLASSVLVNRETNCFVDAGVRWKFGQPLGWRGFLHVDLEIGGLFEGPTRMLAAGRVGGGAGYYSSPGFGFTLGTSFAMGPTFGDGVHFAAALDLLLGLEFLF
jgi:hypothetical protein